MAGSESFEEEVNKWLAKLLDYHEKEMNEWIAGNQRLLAGLEPLSTKDGIRKSLDLGELDGPFDGGVTSGKRERGVRGGKHVAERKMYDEDLQNWLDYQNEEVEKWFADQNLLKGLEPLSTQDGIQTELEIGELDGPIRRVRKRTHRGGRGGFGNRKTY